MKSKLAVLTICLTVALASFAVLNGCTTSPSSSDPKDWYTGGKWITRDVTGSGDGYDVVFKENNTFDGYLPGSSSVKIFGPYAVDAKGNVTGTFEATSGGRIGRIEAYLLSKGTILHFRFIETNAFNRAADGIVILDCEGPNPTKPPMGEPPASWGLSAGGGTGSSADEIPAADVKWSYADASQFKVTAQLTSVTVTLGNPAPTICWNRIYPASWPANDGSAKIDGSMWVIANVGGQWYGSVWEGIRTHSSGQCSTTEANAGQPPFIQTSTRPTNTWYPKHGEKVGFMVSVIARGGTPKGTPLERSQIKLVTWP